MKPLSLNENPFTRSRVLALLKPGENSFDLGSRENSQLEFKEAFSYNSIAEYSRTMAAFANNRGGYLVFGVTDAPRQIKGLKDTRFEEMDTKIISEFLNEYFEPELCWTPHVHEIAGKRLGMLYTFQSENRPVICRKNKDKLKEAAIYYRYRGTTRNIKFTELQSLLREQRELERSWWLSALTRLVTIGVQDAAVLSTVDGTVSGPKANFFIDSSLLEKIKFVRSGRFAENEGEPTLRVIGDAEVLDSRVVQPLREITKTRAIRWDDIISDFIRGASPDNPVDYITQSCFGSSSYMPVYFFAREAGMGVEELLSHIASSEGGGSVKKKLGKRVSEGGRGVQKAGPRVQGYRAWFLGDYAFTEVEREKLASLPEEDVRAILDSVCTIEPKEFHRSSVCEKVRECLLAVFGRYHQFSNDNTKQSFRYTVCHLDESLYDPRCSSVGAGDTD